MVDVQKDERVEFVFTRKTDKICTKDMVIDTGLAKVRIALPLDKAVTSTRKSRRLGSSSTVAAWARRPEE